MQTITEEKIFDIIDDFIYQEKLVIDAYRGSFQLYLVETAPIYPHYYLIEQGDLKKISDTALKISAEYGIELDYSYSMLDRCQKYAAKERTGGF